MTELRMVGQSDLVVRESAGRAGPVLLCHGNSLAGEIFEPQLRSSLGERYRLIALDLPGHGDSPDDPARYGFGALVEAIVEVARALELERPILVGHSLGGHLMSLAAGRLASPRGLFVFGSPLMESLAALPEAFMPHPAVGLLFKPELDDDEVASLTSLLAPGGGVEGERVERRLRRTDPRFREILAASLQAEHRDELAAARGLEGPVAIAHGADDPLVNRAYLEGLSLPNLWRQEVQIIDGAGHLPQADAPDRLNALLGAFLDDVS